MDNRSRQADYLSKISVLYRNIVARAFEKTASPRQAIKAKCLACCNMERDKVANCTTVLCPLHEYRPYQTTRKAAETMRRSPTEAGAMYNIASQGSGSAMGQLNRARNPGKRA